jgi:hypothetical protein
VQDATLPPPDTRPISTDTEKASPSDPLLIMVDQPAKLAMRRDIDAPSSSPMVPPATAISVVSMTNCRMTSVRRAPMARRTPISRPLEDTREHDIHDAGAADQQRDGREGDHDDVEDTFGALLFGQELRRHNERIIGGATMRRGEDPAHGGRRGEDVGVGLQADVDAVHVVAELAVVVFELEHRRTGRCDGRVGSTCSIVPSAR